MRRLALPCAVTFVVLILLVAHDRTARARARALTTAEGHVVGERAERTGDVGATVGFTAEGVPRIDLRAGGEILLDGHPADLSALRRACAGKQMVVLRVGGCPWSHVEWVLAALEAAGVRRVTFDLPGGEIEACFDSDYWKQDARHLLGGHTAGVVNVSLEELNDPSLPSRLMDEAARIEQECGLRPVGQLEPMAGQDFGVVEHALRALSDAGIEIEFRFLLWDDTLPVSIPPPDGSRPGDMSYFYRCPCRSGILGMDLPVADMAEEDKGQEEDDRIVVQLRRDGSVFFKSGVVSLDELSEVLGFVRERYELKMRQQGKSGVERVKGGAALSKVYVLVRADRAAPPRQVGWILHVLDEAGFYKVQFAVARGLGQAAGPCVGGPGAKLQVFLPTDDGPGIAGDGPFVHVYVDPQSFGVGATGGLDADDLCRTVQREAAPALAEPGRKVVIGIHVAAGVEWERVMTAVNEIYRAGLQRIEFVDLQAPDEMTRRMSPLPR